MQKWSLVKGFILTILVLAVLQSCKKNEAAWENDFLAPIASTRLNFSNLLNDSLLESDENGLLHIKFKNTFQLIPFDSLVNLPDTTLYRDLSIPFPVQIPPGLSIFSQNQELVYNLNDIKITEVIVESGFADVLVKSIIPRKIIFNYSVPKATLDGVAIQLNDQEIAAFNGDTVIGYKFFNLAWHIFNLRGDNESSYNRLRLLIDAKISPDEEAYTPVPNQTLIRIENSFKQIKPYFARGYFGNRIFSNQNVFTAVEQLSQIEGLLALDQVYLNLKIENGVGVDLRFKLNELKGFNSRINQTVNLQHSLVGAQVNLGRALNQVNPDNGLPFTATSTQYLLNPSNSNIKTFLENLPDEININIDAQVNPLGNVSSGNDFIYSKSNVNMLMDLDIPLKFGALELSLIDTLDFNLVNNTQIDRLKKAKLMLIADNFFPIELIPELLLLDSEKNLLAKINSEGKIESANVNDQLIVLQRKRSIVIFDVNQDVISKLKKTEKIVVKLKLNTKPENELVPIYHDYFIDLKLTSDFTYFMQP